MANKFVQTYLREIEQIHARGNATEHSYRGALQRLTDALNPKVRAVNEPKRVNVGAPDYIIMEGETPLGYIEAKDIGVDLDGKDTQKQLARYVDGLGNVILTDYLEFRWYVNDSKNYRHAVTLAKPSGKKLIYEDNDEKFIALFEQFLGSPASTVKSAKELALRMAKLADIIRDIILNAINEGESVQLNDTMKSFREVLLHDMTDHQFADMYAQTISYGMFAARVNHTDKKKRFERMTAGYDLPKTNPFLRQLFNTIGGPELDERVTWAVDELANLLRHTAMEDILRDFGTRTRQEDPVVHFYETFLAAYDPKLRESRGVYYTPEPVVSYIVRSVDHILKTDFGLEKGLADSSKIVTPKNVIPANAGIHKDASRRAIDSRVRGNDNQNNESSASSDLHKVLILDPACGTGTFLHGVIDQIHDNFKGNEGAWSSYVSEHLLPRIFGFELLMAPYAVAHLKLGLQLKEFGYDFKSDERLRVYLTNTLEEAFTADERLPFSNYLAKEANAANVVKRDLPIMVVLGNPPYSNFGMMNKGTWIKELLKEYKEGLNEKKINLDDDFIKFIRFAQWRIEQTGYGILAYISNNSYLDGITHRKMRESLLGSFDDIYILNLHGSSKKKELSPDGTKDENVFDIQQGVSIAIFVKKKVKATSKCKLRYKDVWGERESKYKFLGARDINDTKWQTLNPSTDSHYFVPKDFGGDSEYEKYLQLIAVFKVFNNGFKTDRDSLFIDYESSVLSKRMKTFYNAEGVEGPFANEYNVKDSSSYDLLRRRKLTSFDSNNIRKCLYRPFDIRWIYYNQGLTSRPASEVMRHLLPGSNFAMVTMRQTRRGETGSFLVYDGLINKDAVSLFDIATVFPLYLYPDATKKDLFSEASTPDPTRREPNLSPAFIAEFSERLNLKFIPDGKGNITVIPANAGIHKVASRQVMDSRVRGNDNMPVRGNDKKAKASTGQGTFGPEDVFHYMYAVFHSPTYRLRYAEFLKIDFPRLPLTSNLALFRELCKLGEELVKLHLMEKFGKPLTGFRGKGSDMVEYVKYSEETGRVQINEDQYFEGIPDAVWNFHIGGYQVAQKWLKDRKNRTLSYDDIEHYHHIISALSETMRLMKEIDEVIAEAGGFPLK